MRSPRLLVAVILAGLAQCAAGAAPSSWPTWDSIDIGSGTAVAAASDGRYGLLTLWYSGTTLYAQRTDPIAAPMWGAGVVLTPTNDLLTAGVQVLGSATDDGMRGGVFAWTDTALKVHLARVGLVAAVPTKIFDVVVSLAGKECHSPRLLRTSGGVLVVYVNDSAADAVVSLDAKIAGVIELALVASDGTVMKRAQLTAMHPEGQLRVFPDGAGGAIIAWDVPPYVDSARNMPDPTATWGVRVDGNLVSVWERIDDDPLYARRANTASVAPDGQGGLWVAGRRSYGDAGVYSIADNGEFVVVNRVTATGANAWNSWVKALEWDCHEKREYQVKGIEATASQPAQYFDASDTFFYDTADSYQTDQHTPRLVADGSGGVYVLVKDDRMFPIGGTIGGDGHPPAADEHLYAQHLSSSGVRAWDANQAGMYFSGTTLDPSSGLNVPLYEADYGWKEGAEVRNSTDLKQQPIAESKSWEAYDTFEGEILNEPFVSVWAEDVAGTWNIYAVELDPAGDMRTDLDATWGGAPITIKSDVGDQSEGGTGIFTVSHERFGTYVVWTNGLTVQAAHLNFFEMWDLWRVDDAVGPGPDIFSPGPVTDLQAVPQAGWVELTWNNPSAVNANKPFADFDGVMIVRTTDAPALSPYDFPEDAWRDAGPTELYHDYSVELGVTYYYTAFAYDTEFAALNFSTPAWTSVRVGLGDVVNFQAYGASSTSIELSWTNPASEDYAGVEIWRDEAVFPTDEGVPGTATLVQRVLLTDPQPESWTDTGLTANTLYYYSAFPLDDPVGDPFPTLGARAAAATVGGVTGFTATAQDAQVSLTWDNPTVDPAPGAFEGVVICRVTGSTPPVGPTDGPLTVDPVPGLIGQPGAYLDIAVTNGTQYTYAAFAAYDFGGTRVYGVPGESSATPIDNVAPRPVTGFAAEIREAFKIHLSWTLPDPALPVNLDLDGLIIVRKADSYPTSRIDGVVVLNDELTEPLVGDADQVVSFSVVLDDAGTTTNPLVVGRTYYYAAWTYDRQTPPNYSLPPAYAVPALAPVSNMPPEIIQGPGSAGDYSGGVIANWTVTVDWTATDPDGDAMTAVVRWGLDASGVLSGQEIRWITGPTVACPEAAPVSFIIDGLKAGATYVYEVTVTDSTGLSVTVAGVPFTVAAPPVGAPPTGDDSEPDGLPDSWENLYGGTAFTYAGDDDSDGLQNIFEYWFGGDPTKSDTDADGFSDYDEVMDGSDPGVSYWEDVQGAPLTEEAGGCGSGGRALPAWALVLAAAALVLMTTMRRRAAGAR